eukprot:CAMPEP_0179041738 /NCGR_PEP_ID=MMETSP0796-20121207/16309_1 /TAXON_ID=73915 /ORGANISM="Pyrodinium bahamense, Strain pbaha01" /LENGTH=649 /DNA_ID=CAMNT_0020738107 /DNA_START=74 /DNA_END=2023 /DNA_ORIENTATION=+
MWANWRLAFNLEGNEAVLEEEEEEEDNSDTGIHAEHCRRLCTSQISDLRLLPSERQRLREEQGLGRIAARYLAWRSTLLFTGTTLFVMIVIVDGYLLYQQFGQRSPFLMKFIPRRYQQHFGNLVTYHLLQQACFVAAEVVSVVTAAISLWRWRYFLRSNGWLRGSFACSFVPPFMVLLLVPYRDSVDVKAIMKQICLETSTVVPKRNYTTTQGRMRDMIKRAGLGIADDFRFSFDIDCDHLEAAEWMPVLIDRIEKEGLLMQENGTCPYAQKAAEFDAYAAFPQTEWSKEHCPDACQNCTQACLDWLVPLGTIAGLYGSESIGKIITHTLKKLDGVNHCVHCFSKERGLRCAWRCEGIRLALSLRSLLKEGPNIWSPTCVSREWVMEMRLWGDVLAHPSYWHMLLGTAYAMRSLRWLMPLATSVMIGASYGCRIAKSTIPFSRIPALLNFAAVVFSLPFVFTIAVVIQNIFGGAFTFSGIVFTVIFIVASLRPSRLKAETHDDLKEARSQYDRVMYASLLAAIFCFASSMLTDSLALAWFRLLHAKGLVPNLLELHHMKKEDIWTLLRLLVTLVGTSRISAVFFADEAVMLMHHFHEGEARDSADVKSRRSQLQRDIATIHGGAIYRNRPKAALLKRPFGMCCGGKTRA